MVWNGGIVMDSAARKRSEARQKSAVEAFARVSFPLDHREEIDLDALPDILPSDRGPDALPAPRIPPADMKHGISLLLHLIGQRTSDPAWAATFEAISARLKGIEERAAEFGRIKPLLDRLPEIEAKLEEVTSINGNLLGERNIAQRESLDLKRKLDKAKKDADDAYVISKLARGLQDEVRDLKDECSRLQEEVGLRDKELGWSERYDQIVAETEVRVFEDAHYTMGHIETFYGCSKPWCRKALKLVEDGVSVPKGEYERKDGTWVDPKSTKREQVRIRW